MKKPPLVGRALLRLLPRRLHEVIAGDLEELWRERRLTHAGYVAAVLRSLVDVMRTRLPVRPFSLASASGGVSGVSQDVLLALRMMRRHRAVTLAAVLTLAIGIGGSTAIFSTVYPTLFEPLPYPASERLIAVCDRARAGGCLDVTFGTYRELLARTRTLASLAVMRDWQPVLAREAEAERLAGQRVSAAYFRVLGVHPQLGRGLTDDDDRPGAARVVVLSDRLWRRHFAAAANVLGKPVLLGSAQYTVVGVMPQLFENVLAPEAELWTALQYDPALPPDGREWGHHLRLIARLVDGVSLASAEGELTEIARSPVPQFPRPAWASMRDGLIVSPLRHDLTQGVRPLLLAFSAAVLLVLVIACVNVANLLLARAVQRRREFALRVALGAGRWRMVRQLLVEGLLLALPGGAIGVAAAQVAVHGLLAVAPAGLPRAEHVEVDGIALVFSMLVTIACALAVAVLPALQTSRRDLQRSLQQDARTAAGGPRRARQVLVVAEVGLALVLLVSAGLLFRSLRALVAVAPGFIAEDLVVAEVQTAGARVQDQGTADGFFERVAEAVRGIPGVSHAAVANQLPLTGQADRYGVSTEYAADTGPEEDRSAFRYAVSPGYFEAMRIPLRRGRALTDRDRAGAPLAVVISESLARRRFARHDPTGQRLRIGADDAWFTVVGVVADVKQRSLSEADADAVYVTPSQWRFPDAARWLVVRSSTPQGLGVAIRAAVRSVDAGQPVARLATMRSFVDDATSDRRFALTVFAGFGGVALVLAVTGLYTALARSVTERTREIGVRAALGASRGEIVLMVLRQGAGMAAVGVLLGIAGAAFATRMLETLLFETTPLDAGTYAAVVCMFAVVVVVASGVPALRATAIDPAISLRVE